ncbi:MAG: enoyl-CoA hydratase-related protein, partial [Actinobacteria bacterium]|nr:enoyl-CoA hydratase-related protein [Actinomycetota bacterium]
HHLKVNFCKFTNETRNSIEDATTNSGQTWIAAVNGTAAGGGYELALACDKIVLIDDRSSTVSLPEVPLLGVLPGTGGLTRVVDKRHVRRDLADVFATRAEGVKGRQAVEWGLVDILAPKSRFLDVAREVALEKAARSDRGEDSAGISLIPLERVVTEDKMVYPNLTVSLDRQLAAAIFTIEAPSQPLELTEAEIFQLGAQFWPLALCRELDDAVLRLRFNEPELGTWVFKTQGDPSSVLAADDILKDHFDQWLVREIRLYWARTLRRIELSSRSIVTLIEPGSCFVGTLAELFLVADRSFMLEGTYGNDPNPAAFIQLSEVNDGWYPMTNGLSRLGGRYLGHPDDLEAVRGRFGKELLAKDAAELGLVTFTPDELDFADEVRLMLEERASFSPDALSGMEANYRFAGPETMETKIFARLSAWQNWIFQRPNAVGEQGALKSYGTGSRPIYDRRRI